MAIDRLMRLPEVKSVVGYSRTTIYRLISAGGFPPGVKLGEQAIAWRESDVQAWVASRQSVVVRTMCARPNSDSGGQAVAA